LREPLKAWPDLKEVARRHAQRVGRPVWETWLLEPGLHALVFYRAARWCFERGWVFPARCLSAWGRRSGCDLSPAAKIGRNLIIQQATGVVVGPTAVIGDDCVLEPGAMLLGAGLALPTADAQLDAFGTSRTHPSLGNNVLVEAGAVVVGDVFVGNDVRIFAGAVVTRDVPDGGIALGVPGRVLPRAQARPDPDARAAQALAERVYHLEEQLQILAFAAQRQLGGLPRARQPDQYGPLQAVEDLIDGAGI
jgi:serine O-acetyltransferase